MLLWQISRDYIFLVSLFQLSFCSVLLGQSSAWKMHVIDNTSFGSDGTKVYDVNGDHHQDIICGWEQGHVARLYINPHPQTNWSFIEVPAPDVEDALVMDLDNDGNVDIVTFSEGEHRRITFHWAPTPEHYQKSSHWTSEDVTSTIGVTQWMFGQPMDVDRKNGQDIIVAAKNDGAMIGWLESPENPRDVNAWKLHLLEQASWVMSIEIIDIDHDGLEDILYTDRNGSTNGVKWLKHPGPSDEVHSKWQGHVIGLANRDPMFLDVAPNQEKTGWVIWVPDLRRELFCFEQMDKAGLVWKADSIPFPEAAGLVGKSAAIGEIDGDQKPDLVTTYDGAANRAGVIWSNYHQESHGWTHHDVSGPAGNKFDFAYLIDLDYDGDLDVLTSEENQNSSTVPGLGVVWYENPHR